jgi:hypothetical protein
VDARLYGHTQKGREKMGSVGEYPKGETPFLKHIKQHNTTHAKAIKRCAHATPIWRKIAATLGWKKQLYRWQASNQHKYWK